MGRRSGSITVFLSLSGILVLALIGTLLETARYTICQNYVKRTLQVASEGLLTEYSRPLYENYGLFFIESAGTPYEQVISRYASDAIEKGNEETANFFPGHMTEVSVVDKTYVGDNEAKVLQDEITDYMSRLVTKETLQDWLGKTSSFEEVEKNAKEIEEEVDAKKKEAKQEEEILRLIKLVDGISVENGEVHCEPEFVKMFVVKEKRGADFGITEGAVWEKMKGKLDDMPKTWKGKSKSEWLKRVRRVASICEQAIEIGNRVTHLVSGLPSLKGNLAILNKTESILKEHSIEESKEQLNALWKDYDTTSLVFDYTGVGECGGGENPKDLFGLAWSKGILNLVCSEDMKISKKSISNPDSHANLYKNQEKSSEDSGESIERFAKEDEVSLSGALKDVGSYAINEFCLDKYIQKHFYSVMSTTSSKWKQSLDYGLEYVVSGKNSDEANLQSVLNRILLVRTVLNFTTICRDKAKKREAQTAALAVVGFTGMQLLVKLVQVMILLTWSMVESLVDIAGLLLGKHVPMIKKKSEITTSFPQVFQITRSAIVGRAEKLSKEKKSSFAYSDYLMLFLATMRQSTRRYRVMDLIQNGMRENGYETFQFGSCVHDMEVQGSASFPSVFFRMSILETMLGRNLQTYGITSTVRVSY